MLFAVAVLAGIAVNTDGDTIMKEEGGTVFSSLTDGAPRSLIGRKVGKMSRLEVEKLPRREEAAVSGLGVGSEGGAVSWDMGLSPDCTGWSPIPNMLPRTICGGRDPES